MGRKINGDVVILVAAFWLGYFIDNYESKNPCPPSCKIEHEHRISNDKSDNNREDIKSSIKEV